MPIERFNDESPRLKARSSLISGVPLEGLSRLADLQSVGISTLKGQSKQKLSYTRLSYNRFMYSGFMCNRFTRQCKSVMETVPQSCGTGQILLASKTNG